MQDIIKRINDLIIKCDRMWQLFEYQHIVFEIDELLISLVGKNTDFYNNFMMVFKNQKLSIIERGQLLVGILNGLKTHLELCSKNKKYQIFVSSTYRDLIKYRECVADLIVMKGHVAVGMEDFTACGDNLESYIKKEIDQSDYYILLVGQRFGSHIPNDENVSYTMMEYYYAKSKSIRIIPFIYNGNKQLANNDLNMNGDKLKKFICEVQKTVPQYFKDKNELSKKLTISLENEFKNYPQKGWIRF